MKNSFLNKLISKWKYESILFNAIYTKYKTKSLIFLRREISYHEMSLYLRNRIENVTDNIINVTTWKQICKILQLCQKKSSVLECRHIFKIKIIMNVKIYYDRWLNMLQTKYIKKI